MIATLALLATIQTRPKAPTIKLPPLKPGPKVAWLIDPSNWAYPKATAKTEAVVQGLRGASMDVALATGGVKKNATGAYTYAEAVPVLEGLGAEYVGVVYVNEVTTVASPPSVTIVALLVLANKKTNQFVTQGHKIVRKNVALPGKPAPTPASTATDLARLDVAQWFAKTVKPTK